MKDLGKRAISLWIVFMMTLIVGGVNGQPRPPSDDDRELIVLLKHGTGHPDPALVASAINSGNPAPGGLSIGNPLYAEQLTPHPTGRLLSFVTQRPDSPEARAPYYLMIGFESQVNLEALAQAFLNNPHVAFTEINKEFRYHAATAPTKLLPSDVLVGTGTSLPNEGQWALHLLNFPAAWELGPTGHGQVGILDVGLDTLHKDLVMFDTDPMTGARTHGPFRAHLSADEAYGGCGVDEREERPDKQTVGHGSLVTGLIGAASDNSQGISGGIWGAAIQMIRMEPARLADVVDGLRRVISNGVQAVNMSFGLVDESPCIQNDPRSVCTEIQKAVNRDIVLVASAGNDLLSVEFPGNDQSVISVGGLEWIGTGNQAPIAQFWSEQPNCPMPGNIVPTRECGSNFGPKLTLSGPARDVISTAYTGANPSVDLGCGDDFHPEVGYGPCHGTSFSGPLVVGVVMLIRSVNPLLSRDDVYYIITSTASQADNRTDQLGFGYPNAEAAVLMALGRVQGKTLVNRLTPLFSFFGESGNPDPVANPGYRLSETWFYTSVPSNASGMLLDAVGVDRDPYRTAGPKEVPGYSAFPGLPACEAPCDTVPRASIYVFTTPREPFPGAPKLVPLYRMRYDPDILQACRREVPIVPERDFAFAITPDEAWSLNATEGYVLDTIEGYLFESCEGQAGCTPPAGSVKVYQAFNPSRHDHALFPESELASMQADGYTADLRVVGYAYPNSDQDGDTLIDAFEEMAGTDPRAQDTDCDGVSDGMEITSFDQTQGQYGDALDGPCWTLDTLFANGFESGDTSRWSVVSQ